jgi:PAS domain-containing protein
MTPFEKLDRFLRNLYETAFYFAAMAVKENFRNYIRRAGTVGPPAPTMAILGNGPALAEELPHLLEEMRGGDRDFLAVNFFAEDERFTELRPAYYVLSDPMFFRDTTERQRVEALYRAMNERVAWPMNLYVQYYNPERFDYRAALPNPNIRIVPFHTLTYRGFRRLEFWLYRHGLGSANFGTVVQVGEYIVLLLGYKRIELYGVDHTLLEGLCVDDANRLCRADRHYYDGGEPADPRPMYQKVPRRPYTMAVYLAEVAELFRGHEVLRDYARSLGARIVNRTRGSMIDAYERERF